MKKSVAGQVKGGRVEVHSSSQQLPCSHRPSGPGSNLIECSACGYRRRPRLDSELRVESRRPTLTDHYGSLEFCQSKGETRMNCTAFVHSHSSTGSTPVPSSYAWLEAYSYPHSARLGVQRLRTLQEKKNAQAKAARRDIALLLEKGRLETARIKTENSE